MMKLWHDDVRPAPEGWIWVRTNEQAQAVLENCWPITECSLDHDLGHHDVELPEDPDELAEVLYLRGTAEQTGYNLVEWMVDNGRVPPRVTIHSWNPDGARRMASLLASQGCEVLVAPFRV